MSIAEVVTSILATVSIVLSLWAAMRAGKVGFDELRLSKRVDLHSMLLDIDKVLVDEPRIAALFKSIGADLPPIDDPLLIVKGDVYIQMHLNLFELSFSQFKELKLLNRAEEEISDAWDRTIVEFFKDCDRAEVVWRRQRDEYYDGFREYVDKLSRKALDAMGNLPKAT